MKAKTKGALALVTALIIALGVSLANLGYLDTFGKTVSDTLSSLHNDDDNTTSGGHETVGVLALPTLNTHASQQNASK